MADTDLSVVASALVELLDSYGVTRDQIADVLGGHADGGPNGDGFYPATSANGVTRMVPALTVYVDAKGSDLIGFKHKYANTSRLPLGEALGLLGPVIQSFDDSVVGAGNNAVDVRAIYKMQEALRLNGGGSCTFPPTAYGYGIERLEIAANANTSHRVDLIAYGTASLFRPVSAVPAGEALIDVKLFQVNITGFWIQDVSGIVMGNAIRHLRTERNDLPSSVRNTTLVGFQGDAATENCGAEGVLYERMATYNCKNFHYNRYGGVGNSINGWIGRGGERGIVLDGNTPPPGTTVGRHAEGYSLNNLKLAMGPATGLSAVEIVSGLDFKGSDWTVGQMGPNGRSIILGGREGEIASYITLNNITAEGSDGNPAIDADQRVSRLSINGGTIGNGFYANSDGFRFNGVNGAVIDNMQRLAVGGRMAQFYNCNNITVRRGNGDWSGGAGTIDVNSIVYWEGDENSGGIPLNRSFTSYFPRAKPSDHILVAASTDTGVLPASVVATAKMNWDANQNVLEVSVAAAPGFAGSTGALVIILPAALSSAPRRQAWTGYISPTGQPVYCRIDPAYPNQIQCVTQSSNAFPLQAGQTLTLGQISYPRQ